MALKESLDTIYEKASEVAQAAAQKTKQLAEIAKAGIAIHSEEDKVKKAQLELGKIFYRDYVVGEEMDEAEYLPWCRQIDECKQTIADLQDYIEELKAQRVDMDYADDDPEDLEEVADEAAEEHAEPTEAEPTEATEAE